MMSSPNKAYDCPPGGVLDVDKAFYDIIAEEGGRIKEQDFIIPIRSGKAWVVPAGHVCRIRSVEGPQVGDFNCWNLHNPREHFWNARTRQLESTSITTYSRLWSNLPYMRPMITFTADTLAGYVDPDGGNVHDLLGSRCDPYINRLLAGYDFDYHCHSNLTRAILPFGLEESDVHDVLNVFQLSGLNDRNEYFMKATPVKPGDYLEFFAEIDVLCAMSACPGGDLSVDMWGPNAASTAEQLRHCHPLGVQVFAVSENKLTSWKQPQVSPYKGQNGKHGLHATAFTKLPVEQ